MFADTHCHLDFPEFDADRDEVIQRARESHIDFIINIGSGLEGAKKSLELSRQYNFIYPTLGFHPHEADRFDKDIESALRSLVLSAGVVAIGEIGLDYYRNYADAKKQKSVFGSLLGLAKDLGLPVIVHSRQASADTLGILKKAMPISAVVHCFSQDEDFLKECLDLGFFISFTCNISYKKAKNLRNLVKITPLEKLLLETDAPFLPPQEFRGSRNEPMYVKFLAKEIAAIKALEIEKVGQVTTDNARRFFNLK